MGIAPPQKPPLLLSGWGRKALVHLFPALPACSILPLQSRTDGLQTTAAGGPAARDRLPSAFGHRPPCDERSLGCIRCCSKRWCPGTSSVPLNTIIEAKGVSGPFHAPNRRQPSPSGDLRCRQPIPRRRQRRRSPCQTTPSSLNFTHQRSPRNRRKPRKTGKNRGE
jgi:hypothetical protein